VRLLSLALAALLLLLAVPHAWAQDAGTPAPTTEATATPAPPAPASPANPLALIGQDQINGLFDKFVAHGFGMVTDGLRGGLQKTFDDTNLLSQTPAVWTYQQPTVVALRDGLRLAANAATTLVIFWTGLNITLRPYFGEGYPEVRQAVPRLLLGVMLANSTHIWTVWLVTLNNDLCTGIVRLGTGGQPGDLLARMPSFDGGWLTAGLIVLFLLACVWLYLKLALRLATLLVLLVLAPLATVSVALPQTRGLSDGWWQRFLSTLFAQVVVAVALKLVVGFAETAGTGPVALLITICLIFTAASSPELLATSIARVTSSDALQAARAGSGLAAGGSAGVARTATTATTRGAGASGAAAHPAGSPGWAGSATGKGSSFGRGGRSVAVSGMGSGTGAGVAAAAKAQHFVRGGRAR